MDSTTLTKEAFEAHVADFLETYRAAHTIAPIWRAPLVGFADAHHPLLAKVRERIPEHALPEDVLPGAKVVLVVFVPFSKELAETNACAGLASVQWAKAYEDTNAMFGAMNDDLVALLAAHGVRAAVAQAASTFDREKLVSHWSHRHFAYLAGLGTFGINNMLITRSGGCGRYTTVVTDLDVTPGQPLATEYCLYKKNGKCGACLRRCPTGALTTTDGTGHYDRHKCFAILKKNAEAYQDFGSSYTNEDGTGANSVGSEVCGKCTVHVPCAMMAPGM